MLPQFQRFAQDGAGSLNSSTSLTHFPYPRCYEDLLSSAEADCTLAVEEKMSLPRRLPSPSPLLCISVPLPRVVREESAAKSPSVHAVGHITGLVRSPARASAQTQPSCESSSSNSRAAMQRQKARDISPAYADIITSSSGGATRYVELSHSDASAEDDDAEVDDVTSLHHDATSSHHRSSLQFDHTSFSGATDSNASMDSNDTHSTAAYAAARAPSWCVVWWHLFPQHIAGFLTVRDVLEVGLVSRTAQAAVRQPWVWRALAACHYAVQASSVERVFCTAARAWTADANESSGETTRLLACTPQNAALALPTPQPHAEVNFAHEVRALTASTATTPWLMREATDTLTSEDGVEMEEDEDGEDEGPDGEFNSTQPPQTTREEEEEEEECDRGIDGQYVNVASGLSGRPPTAAAVTAGSPNTTQGTTITMPVSTLSTQVSASAQVAATHAATATASRYLWQNAAATMPSPSSPVTSSLAEEEEVATEEGTERGEEGNGAESSDHEGREGALASTDSEPLPNRVVPTPYPLSFHSVAATAAPPLLTPSPASTTVARLPVYAALPAGRDLTTVMATGEHSVTSASTSNSCSTSNGNSKCAAALSRATQCEELPPPTPAQLEGTTHHALTQGDGELSHNDINASRRAAGMTIALPSASLSFSSSPKLCRQPSYLLEKATDVTVTNMDGGAASPLLPATGAAAFEASTLSSPSPAPVLGAKGTEAAAATADATAVCCFTLCRATAERTLLRLQPVFPWQLFTRFLYTHRVQANLSRYTALSQRAREELCRGAWDGAYGSLSHIIHNLFQQGSCRGVEYVMMLAQSLVRRASLCRHRGHVHLLAAFTDLCTAALLSPDSVTTADVQDLCARDDFSALTPQSWMQLYEDVAQVSSPNALLGTVAQVPFLFPQHRTLCFCSFVASYMRAYRIFGQSLTHLLCRAAELAAPGTEEELLVRALREAARAKACAASSAATSAAAQHYARKACATADYAVSLMPLDVRRATDQLTSAWVRDCFATEGAVYGAAMTGWAAKSAEAIAFARATPLDTRWLAWLTCEVQTFVYKELTDKPPTRAALMSVVLAVTSHDRADGLVRLAASYASYEVRTEDLCPPLPRNAQRRRVTQYLLHNALRLRPLHPTAALLLSRVYAEAEAEDGETEAGDGTAMSSAVLTDCIHRWGRRFGLLEVRLPTTAGRRTVTSTTAAMSGISTAALHLHRRDRCPEVCFIPSELLVGRNHCLHMVADLAEATEQHPCLSYPYQMRAAMAMDRGYHQAAISEMGRIMRLTLDASDVALRVRFVQDALALASPRTPRVAEEDRWTTAGAASAVHVPSPTLFSRSASFESGWRAHDTSAVAVPASASSSPHSPLLESATQLRPAYRGWLAKLSGLLMLLRPVPRDGNGSGGLSTNRLLPVSRELPSMATMSMTTREYGSGHVSRVASMALTETEGECGLFPCGEEAVDAGHVRAFLEDLVNSAAAVSTGVHERCSRVSLVS